MENIWVEADEHNSNNKRKSCIGKKSNFWLLNCTKGNIKKGRKLTPLEPRCEKTGLRGFRPGRTQTGLYSHGTWLEALNFGSRKKRNCTIRVAKTKALISFAVTAKLICVFVFAYAKSRYSYDAALCNLETKSKCF